VQLCEHNLGGWNFFAVDHHVIDRNAASIVDHGDGIINVDCYLNLSGESRQRFIHGVVDNFINQVVQPHLSV
jgi:hypothetical protein